MHSLCQKAKVNEICYLSFFLVTLYNESDELILIINQSIFYWIYGYQLQQIDVNLLREKTWTQIVMSKKNIIQRIDEENTSQEFSIQKHPPWRDVIIPINKEFYL